MNQLFLSSQGGFAKKLIVLLLLALMTTFAFAQNFGDANQDGRVSIIDALMDAQYTVGLSVPGISIANGDVDGNGRITIVDALLIAQYSVGIITVFPAQNQGGELVPDFSVSTWVPSVGSYVTFNAADSTSSGSSIVSYSWDFDDGSTGSGINVSHAFMERDDFKVELTITDASGASASVKKRVFVGRPQGWEEESHHKSTDGAYDIVFPVDKVNRLDITISSSNYRIMEEDLASMSMFNMDRPVYVPVTVQFNGHTWQNVGMRYKGQSTLMSATQERKHKFPIHLNFDKFEDEYPSIDDQRFYGFKELLCNSNWFDASFLKDYICTKIFLDGGVRAARCAYYRVYIDTGNGPVYWGLYTIFEDHADEMLKTQFDDNDGNLYKPEGRGADWSSYQESAFVKKTNKDEANFSDIQAAISALHASRSNPATWRSGLEAVFNVDSFLRWLAINTSIQNVDTYGTTTQNYFLYQDLADNGRLVFIPWDFNLSMDYEYGFMFQPLSLSLSEVRSNWPLIRFLMDDPVYNNQYHDELQKLVNGCFEAEAVIAEINRVHNMISPYVAGPQGEIPEYSFLKNGATQFNEALQSLTNHVRTRRTDILNYLNSHF